MRAPWVAAIAVLCAAAPAFAQQRGFVIGNGGGTSSGGGMVLQATVGQPAVGTAGGASFIVCAGFWCFGGVRVLAVEDPPGQHGSGLPTELAFGPPTPTPSRGAVSFTLALPVPADVSLAVFDVAGREIGKVPSQRLEAGYHRLSWRAPAANPGVYFGLMSVDGQVKARRRIVLVR